MSACLLARAKLAQYVADLRQSSKTEQAVGLIKTGYLSPKTILKKTAGDVVLASVENLVTRPVAVAYDYLASVARSAASFGEKSPSELRSLSNTLSIPGIRFGAKGFRDGLAKSVQILKTGVDADHVMQRFDLQRTTYNNPVVQAIYNGVYNTLHATVKPWYGLAFNTSLYARAVTLAREEGLRGAKATARINELLASPTDEMAIGAAQDAEYATLTNKTALGDAASGLKRNLKIASENPANNAAKRLSAQVGYVGSELAIPYTGVPSAIGGVLVDYSPLGAAKTIGAMVKALGKDAPNDLQGTTAMGLARSTVGTAALWGLGYALAQKGLLTGAMPTDPRERAQWEAEGKQPYSFKYKGVWHSLTGIAPLGLAPLIAADVVQAAKNKERKGGVAASADMAAQAAGSIGKTLTQQSFLQGMSAITDALNDPERNAPKFAAQMIGSPVPSVVGQIAHGIDPVVRNAETVPERIQARLPLLSTRLPARLDAFGDTVSRGSGGLSGVAREMFDVTQSRRDQSTALLSEMDRLGVRVSNLPKKLALPGTGSVQRAPEEYNALVQEFGPLKRQMLETLIASPEYKAATDEERKAALEQVLRSVQTTGTAVDKARRMGESVPRVTLPQMLRAADQ